MTPASQLPLPSDPEEQRKFVELYVKVANIISDFEDKMDGMSHEMKGRLHTLKDMSEVMSTELRNAGIMLKDSDSPLGNKLSDLRSDFSINQQLHNEIKSLNRKIWVMIGAIVIATGLGLFNRFDPPEVTISPGKVILWQYDYEKNSLYTIVGQDTLYKRP